MKPESKIKLRIGSGATGVGLATGAEADWIQLLGALVTVLSFLWPIVEKLLTKRATPDSGPQTPDPRPETQDSDDHPPSDPRISALLLAAFAPLLSAFCFLLLCCLLLSAGCAQFTTSQTDLSYEQGEPQRQITTRATARTLFASRSALANFKASQTDKTQSATVGSLTQESQGTNTVNIVNAIAGVLKAAQ